MRSARTINDTYSTTDHATQNPYYKIVTKNGVTLQICLALLWKRQKSWLLYVNRNQNSSRAERKKVSLSVLNQSLNEALSIYQSAKIVIFLISAKMRK